MLCIPEPSSSRDAEYYSLRKDTFTLPSQHDTTERGSRQFGRDFLSSWRGVVETFTRRQLTKSTDRALAISGIAERFASIMNDRDYVAGLWKPYIHAGLFWRIEQDEVSARPTAYQGPSWSWTSVNGPVTYPYVSWYPWTSEDITMDIISLPRKLVDDRAPFGALHPDSARLKVRGRLAPGAWVSTKSTSLLGKDKKKVVFFGSNDSESGAVGIADMFCDTTELDEEEAARGATGDKAKKPVMVVEMQRFRSRTTWGGYGLVLRRAECNESDKPFQGHVFRRVGVFEFEGKRDAESEEDWKQTIDTKFNWFKNVIPREIEII